MTDRANRKTKIVMVAMFKNEAPVMRRMLESCGPYIDYYVIQNNGSTDGTDQIVKEYFEETGIPGILYEVEEGWVGFGWNRDHLIQTCQSIDHGCDWILKMDCDEVLEVDDSFDWSLLDDTSIHSFHIPAISGTVVYYRAWMWNARMNWAFNHDPCHETIYCTDPNIDHAFQRFDLPLSIRQIGGNEGQSWGNPLKFVSDSLILEEKMLKEGTLFTDLYHFFYIGKSYFDAHQAPLPLGKSHQDEYCRRCIYYLDEFVKHTNPNGPNGLDETAYNAHIMMAEAYEFMGDEHKAIVTYKNGHPYAPKRNDHYFGLARLYKKTKQYEMMMRVAEVLANPKRTNPFGEYISWIDSSMYIDTGYDRVMSVYNEAQELYQKDQIRRTQYTIPININRQFDKNFFVVDNFYNNPDEVRSYALQQEFAEDIRYYKGLRTTRHYHPEGIKQAFEHIIGQKIVSFPEGINGCFQITTSKDPQVYHHDEQKWAAMIYLTPNAPIESGTRLHRSKVNGVRHWGQGQELIDRAFQGDFYDSTKFEVVDSAGNVYNRLVIMDAQNIHSAGPYFGNTPESGRLTHLFFFD